MKKVTPLITAIIIALLIPTCVILARTHVSEQKTILYYANIQVKAGDTLWDIAKANKPENKKMKDYIKEVKKLNRLKTDLIMTGQYLIIPMEYNTYSETAFEQH